ncbi:DUF2586 family protein [Alistipes sp.]|uniref:DUF2586 family protein n=1 Tax=Alistipes sp. TaxID=1872444 RepID=UPI003AB2FE16
MLPRVKIIFANGALGQVEAMADGCLGLLALGAKEVEGDNSFKLGKAYTIKKLSGLEALGVTAENNPNLYRNVKDFYAEAGDGVELWLMGFAEASSFESVLDKDAAAGAKALLQASNGKIRGLIAFKTPAAGYALTVKDGVDADVTAAMVKAQGLGEWATETLRAPIFTLVEGYGFTGDASELKALTTMEFNRVGIVIGDTTPNSKNACMGIVAGRIAISPVQRKISRVKDGALTPLAIYIGDRLVELADVETIHEKGYITFTTFVGRTGYFIADDNLATRVEDDYRALSNRRVIDKAYRVAYNTLLNDLNDEVPIATDGNLSPAWCTAVKSDVEQAIISNMTANGNLGNDPGDPDDTGVECTIDYKQQILSTSQLAVGLRVKPNGYAKYIDVELGFKAA